jgi:hypothetical protein
MLDLQNTIGGIVQPFLAGGYVPDWQARAAQTGLISDYYTIRALDNPLFDVDDTDLGARFGSRSPLREAMWHSFGEAAGTDSVGYVLTMDELRGEERRLFESGYGGVDSVEKMAMTAIAHAICTFTPALPNLLLLAGQFYDEALHLKALSTLLGIDEASQPWITLKRAPFLAAARQARSLAEYVLFQNCLSEGEGAIAAAEILYSLRSLPASSTAVGVARRITVEETNHARIGYTILHRVGHALSPDFFHDALLRYQQIEILRPVDTAKGRRQRLALAVLNEYITTRDLEMTDRMLFRAVVETRKHGSSSR